MSQVNLNDSDCIIQEQNITCITLDDSRDVEIGEEDQPPPASAIDIEEGEVMDVEKETICEIKFPNKSNFKTYGSLIVSCLTDSLNQQLGKVIEIIEEEHADWLKLTVQRLPVFIESIPIPSVSEKPSNTEKSNDKFEKDTSPDLNGISELFTIDTTPVPKIDTVKVPSYKRAVKDALLDEEAAAHKKQKEEASVFKTKKNSCFNCGKADHSIRECPRPHNAKRIKTAKRACSKVERYHVDVEQRFAHIKPGRISDKLREALGLRKGELPFFFYRMRVLGYPPGWLEEAKVEHSGINLFNSDGSKILNSDEDEGEIQCVNHKYNVSKIYDFPGFNQDPGENFFDDHRYHNVPPLDRSQMKEEFIKTLGDNILKGYKRKKLKDFPNAVLDDSIKHTKLEVTDMEIEDPETTTLGEVQFTRPPPPTDQPPSPPPPPPSPSASPSFSCESPISVEHPERNSSTQSPSLLELEKRKRQLLHELSDNTTTVEMEDSLINEIIELEEEDEKLNDQSVENNKTLDDSSEAKVVANDENTENKIDVIKESFMGTPVLKFSPYDNLPHGENFKVGVSDVINFENLPDSTGKYEHMKEVIKKVRDCINKLHKEE